MDLWGSKKRQNICARQADVPSVLVRKHETFLQALPYKYKFREIVREMMSNLGKNTISVGPVNITPHMTSKTLCVVREFTVKPCPELSTLAQCSYMSHHIGRKDFWESGAEQMPTADSWEGPWAQNKLENSRLRESLQTHWILPVPLKCLTFRNVKLTNLGCLKPWVVCWSSKREQIEVCIMKQYKQ